MDRSKPQLLPMEETDLEEAIQIEVYGWPDNDVRRVLFERGRSPAATAQLVERRRKTIREKPLATFLKVVDPASNGIMAWAIWSYFPELTEEEWAKGPVTPEWPLPIWSAPYQKYRHDLMHGRPHYRLSLLVTASEYRRRGAASLLIQWGIDKADEVGIEVYVDSSEAGKPVYEKFGFRALKRIEFNMSQLGYEGIDVHTSMLRPPQGRS